MRNILGIAGGVGLVLVVAVSQIHTSPQNPGGLVPGNAFAQEPRHFASDDRRGSPDVAPPPQRPQAEAAPRPEPRGDRRFTPQRWKTTPTM